MAAKKSEIRLGSPVVYQVLEKQLTTTMRAGEKTAGSTFHPSQTEFAGLVVRLVNPSEAQLVIFPPDRAPVFVVGALGDGPGTFSLVEAG